MKSELEKFYSLADEIEIAMMTTRRRRRASPLARHGHAASAPKGADLWFVTSEGSAKLLDLAHDAHVNLAYCRDCTREWISVSGMVVTSA